MKSPSLIQPLLESGYRQFLGFRFHFDRQRPTSPGSGKVFGVDVVVVSLGFRPLPPLYRAGDVEKRFAVPCCPRTFARLLHGQAVGTTTVMVRVIDQWHPFASAEWQEVGGREGSVIVLNGQVVGSWKRTFKKETVAIELRPIIKLTKNEKEAVELASEKFGDFLGMLSTITWK